MIEKYKDTYCHAHIYFLLKTLNINIKTDTVVTTDGIVFYFPECDEIKNRDCAYRPSTFEIFNYIEKNFRYRIYINKQDEKWEWLVFNQNNKPIVYSGETKLTNNAIYNMGKNIKAYREYFNTELEAIEDAISELLILI